MYILCIAEVSFCLWFIYQFQLTRPPLLPGESPPVPSRDPDGGFQPRRGAGSHVPPWRSREDAERDAEEEEARQRRASLAASVAEFFEVPLIPLFRPRAPKDYFPAPGPFKTGRGRV